MKEASGEANLTVITIILIGVVAAVAIPIIRGMIQDPTEHNCGAGKMWDGTQCISTETGK